MKVAVAGVPPRHLRSIQPMPHAVKQIGDDYYCYDGNGNPSASPRASMTACHDESGRYEQAYKDVETFSYDHLNRLTAATGRHVRLCSAALISCYDHEYVYEATGNFASISRDDVLYTYHADSSQPHAVDSITGPVTQTFTYDGNGNMTARNDESGRYEQEFDVEDRLVAVTETVSSEVTAFYYDASGQRLLTVEPDGTEIYYPFVGYEEEITDTVTIQRSTYFLAGMAIATRISGDPDSSKNGLFFLYSDHLGSNSFMTDDTGVMVPGSVARYLPFGDWRTKPTAGLTELGYTGHHHNNAGSNDIGLIYMNARYYLPGVNRFASADTIVPDPANPQSYNRYSYVLNSPINFTDPTGHYACEDAFDCSSGPGSYNPPPTPPEPQNPWQLGDQEVNGHVGQSPEEILFESFVMPADSSFGRFGEQMTSLYCDVVGRPPCDARHPAVDGSRKRGSPIYAVAYGHVVLIGDPHEAVDGRDPAAGGFGKYVVIEHDIYGTLFYSVYAHNEDILVKVGDIVGPGTPIAAIGKFWNK